MTDFFACQLPIMLRGYNSVFTYSDFQRKNILIREKHPLSTAPYRGLERHFEVAAILDQESASWYPSFQGYTLCFTYFDQSNDQAEKVERILDPYVYKATLIRIVGQDLDS